MNEKNMTIETYNQLKALSDPLRAEIMMCVVERPYTGQQLSETLTIPRGKVHYHLKDLEKNNLIEIVKTEEKNGIMQKFYQAVAGGFTISEELLPHNKEIVQTTKQLMYSILDRAKRRVDSAPKHAFKEKNIDKHPKESGYITTNAEIEATEEQFLEWKRKYYALLEELDAMGKKTTEKTNTYYILNLGFQINEGEYQKQIDRGKNDGNIKK